MALERPEESPLPATAPNVLEQRQEADAPSLERASAPSRPTQNNVPEPAPKADGTPLPTPKRESGSLINSFTRAVQSTNMSSKANTFMTEARKAELAGDKQREAFYREQAAKLYSASDEIRPDINSVDEVNTLGDAGHLLANFFGSATPSVATSIAAGTLGGIGGRFTKPLLKRAPTLARHSEAVGAGGATALSMHDDVKGSIIAQQEADPFISQLPVEQREQAANLTTVGSLGLESLVPGAIGARAGRKLGGNIGRNLGPEDIVRTNRGKMVENIGGEGLTEVSQTFLEEISLGLQNPDRPNTASASEYIDSLLGGMAGGAQGHLAGRSLEGVGSLISQARYTENAFEDYSPETKFAIKSKQSGHITSGNIQRQRMAQNELFHGTGKEGADVFATFMPDVTSGLITHKLQLPDLFDDKKLAKVGDPELAKRMQAAGMLAMTIDNPNIEDTDFQNRRQYVAKTLFPGYAQEDALEIVDSIFDTYVDANAQSSSIVQDEDLPSPEKSEENIEYREPDLVIEGLDEVDTFESGLGGDPTNLSVKLKAQDVKDVWARPDQAARPSKSETSVIHRPAFNNAPWEMNLLNKELESDGQAEVEPVTDWLSRTNTDPIEYGKLLLEDLYERRNRNRQDPKAVLEEKGTATEEGTPFTQEEILNSIQERIDILAGKEGQEGLLDVAEREGSPRAILQHLKNNYSKGAVKTVSPSKDLDLSPTDLKDFSRLNRRIGGKQSRERAEAGRLFPLVYANGKDDTNGYAIHETALETGEKGAGGWVAESIVQTMAAKGRSGNNVFQSGSKRDDLSPRRMLQEGLAGAATLGVVGYLDPKSIKNGKVTGPIVPYQIRGRDKTGKEVGEAKMAIPEVPINARWSKAADAAVTREEKFKKGNTLESAFNADARDAALVELQNFDKSLDQEGNQIIAPAFKSGKRTGILEGKTRATKLVQAALDRVMNALPSGVRRDLGRNKGGQAIDNVIDQVDNYASDETIQEMYESTKAELASEIEAIKASEAYNAKVPKNAKPNKRKRIEGKRKEAVDRVNQLQEEYDTLEPKKNQEDVRAALNFLKQFDETIEGLNRRIKGYEQDQAYIKDRIASNPKQYNSSKFKDATPFEFNTSEQTRTFDTVGEARAHQQKLYRATRELKDIRGQLTDAKAAVDENVEAAMQESTEGLYKESTVESLEKMDQSSLQDETQYDPAAKDTLRKPAKQSKLAEKRKKGLVPPKEPVVPLSEKRIPAAIPALKEALNEKMPLKKSGKREKSVRKHFRVFITDGNKVPKGTRDAQGRFVNRGEYAPVNSAGVLMKDIQAGDIGYLLVGNIASIAGESKNRTSYFNNLIKNDADIYLASDSKVPLDEFNEFMEQNGYSRWTSDPRMFSPTNPRTRSREQADYDQALGDYNDWQSRIADVLKNPDDSLDAQQAKQRARTWGGKDVGKQARKEQEETGEVSKDTLKELRDELLRNQQEAEAAITSLNDYGSKEAREAFYGYLKNLDFSDDAQRARKDLHRTIHANRRVIARMKELLSAGDNQYTLSKKDQARIISDPDFAVAVAYQMWANGDLKITETALGIFKKIITSFLNILGFTMSHQYGEQLYTAFSVGDLKSISDTRTVYRVNQRTFDNAYNSINKELASLGRRVTRGSTDVLRDTKVPELVKLANLLQVSEVNDKSSEIGFIPARRMMQGQFNAHLSNIAKKYTDNELEVGFEEFRTGKVTTKAGRAIRDLNTKIYKYMEDAGVKVLDQNRKTVSVSSRNRRPPIVFDTGAISKNRAGFVKKLRKVGLSDAQAEEVLRGALWDTGSLDLSDTQYDLGRPPNGSELYSGLLDSITVGNRAELNEFERSDPLEAYYTFIRQASHRAEMTRYLGHNGEKIDKALEAAKVKGLSKDQLDFIRTRTVPSLMGTLSYNMSPQLRKIQGGILTMQNLAILPLALFASVVDVMGIPLRTGNMTDAWKAFKDGMRGIANSSDPDFNMAEILGINDGQMLYDRIGDTYNELIDSPWLRKINHKFFLMNGLEGWTKGMRVSAMRAAISYLEDHRNNAQKLEDIGLKKSDLTFTSEGVLDVNNNRKVQEAVYKFVDSAVLRPSASHRPAWGSDPRFLLIWHLKQFTFSFHNVFYKRVATSIAQHGWKNATLIPFLSMIPIMVASDFARNIIAPSAHYESLNFAETILRAVQRSSIAGIGTFGFDMLQDVKFDEYPGTSLLGPTFDSADKFIDSGLSSGLFRLTPGYALTKTWVD